MTSVRLLIVMLSTSTSNDLVMPLISIHLSTSANVFFQGELPRKNTFENRTLSEEPKSFPKSRDNAAPYTVSTFENGIGWKIFPMSTFEKQINLNYFLHLLLLTATTPKAQLLKNGQSRYIHVDKTDKSASIDIEKRTKGATVWYKEKLRSNCWDFMKPRTGKHCTLRGRDRLEKHILSAILPQGIISLS